MFMTNVESSMIVTGKKYEHFQTFGSVTTEKFGILLNVHVMLIVKLVRVKGDDSGIQYSYMEIEVS
jgi:hypothetical protein